MFGLFQRDLRARFPEPRPGGVAVACCGKLPVHREFIRHGLQGRELAALDTWVQEGVAQLNRRFGSEWLATFRQRPPLHFSITCAGGERSVNGVLAASRDQSGREYPVVMACLVDQSRFSEFHALAPLSAWAVHDFLEHAIRIAPDLPDLAAVFSHLEAAPALACSRRRDLIEREIALLRGVNQGELWAAALPGLDPDQQARVLQRVDTALRLIGRRKPHRIHWGLRLPLPRGRHLQAALVFWLQLCDAMAGAGAFRLQAFWRGDGEGGAQPELTLFFRDLPASCFGAVADCGHDRELVVRVCDPATDEVEGDSAPMRALLRSTGLSLLDLVAAWSGVRRRI